VLRSEAFCKAIHQFLLYHPCPMMIILSDQEVPKRVEKIQTPIMFPAENAAQISYAAI
jgi:hypothetical protein